MRARCWVGLVASLLLCGLPGWGRSLSPGLAQALLDAGPDEFVPVVVMMREYPDRDAMLGEVRSLNRRARRAHVISKLRSIASQSQTELRAELAAESDAVRRVRVLWGINGLAFEAKPYVIERLGEAPSIYRILYDRATGHTEIDPTSSGATAELSDDPVEAWPPATRPIRGNGGGPTGGDTSGPNPAATVRGEVIAMGAKQVWDSLGYTGAGLIVAILDTGVDPNHPDLADHIWSNLGEVAGNEIDDDANGYIDDTWGWDFCTGSNMPTGGAHGTQVAGQVAGDGTNGTVTGMAPDAELMVLGIDCDTPSIGWEASDYALAHGADVISQSYSWWWTDQPDYEAFRRQADTELAAGVVHANSAGNDGLALTQRPIPYNVSTPANAPPPWLHPDQVQTGGVSSTLAIGNIDWTTDVIANSSSLGPSAWEDIRANTDPAYPYTMALEYQDYPYANGTQPGLIKPDLSAYGNGTSTTCPGTGYCGFSGTSSAAPHVSGTLALMLQANSEATPAEIAEAIMTTAEHRGSPGKNNVYGTGLLQSFPAVAAIESGTIYQAHTFDDTLYGNGDLRLDPGEQVTMQVAIESRTDVDIQDLVAVLSTTTPGVTIHDSFATFPLLPARGTVLNDAPNFSLTVDPTACATVVDFDLRMLYDGHVRRSTFQVRVGEEQPLMLLEDDFESDLGWNSDPGTTTRGAWVRADPIGVNGQGQLSNPEDDTTVSGVTCWVTGNGDLSGQNGENNNDVDNGSAFLTSPAFGEQHMLSMTLSYDRWYYDNSSGGDSFKAEVSNDGGQNWLLLENTVTRTNGWGSMEMDLMALLAPTDDMRLRFVVTDGADDTAVEGAVDEVIVQGQWVNCQDFTPATLLAPNPVGDSVRVDVQSEGHTRLTWQAPPQDAAHDAATLYRIDRADSPNGSFVAVGSSTTLSWVDVDAMRSTTSYYYRVRAENSGGSE